MNLTVERVYCHEPLRRTDARFLIAETVAFCEAANPLFLSRPDWMVTATCVSAYGFCGFYVLIAVVVLTRTWASFRTPLTLFMGAKLNAILFYHVMEFTSTMPPPNIAAYFAVESPYLLSIGLVLYKILAAEVAQKQKGS
eukprot:CAMPEP_0119381714 /NCGR_PEP_ID=MMETSP1334-20130426/66738_1 /TAXON_ID=127549 /ORGANISM="Calcidiscus leptoporus, Strain RCC1130" /LENGTH=139 /DNA_ID=CAMNT_0007401939 /DNA_START=22 /DNA_END=441 /DNA_ORIENTATION=-